MLLAEDDLPDKHAGCFSGKAVNAVPHFVSCPDGEPSTHSFAKGGGVSIWPRPLATWRWQDPQRDGEEAGESKSEGKRGGNMKALASVVHTYPDASGTSGVSHPGL